MVLVIMYSTRNDSHVGNAFSFHCVGLASMPETLWILVVLDIVLPFSPSRTSTYLFLLMFFSRTPSHYCQALWYLHDSLREYPERYYGSRHKFKIVLLDTNHDI